MLPALGLRWICLNLQSLKLKRINESALFKYNQYAPMFSFDGSYISYITQTNNTFELNVVQRPKYNSAGDCVENEEPDNNSFSRSKHEKVDNIIKVRTIRLDTYLQQNNNNFVHMNKNLFCRTNL